ncbi:hypothetical protein ACTXT7_009360 [Hymenolepis weldensis]
MSEAIGIKKFGFLVINDKEPSLETRTTVITKAQAFINFVESAAELENGADSQIAEFLLDHGSCLEARSGWEDLTPLHLAAYFDCPQILRLLLSRGADPLVRSAALEGATPLHLAAAQLSLASARLLAPLPLSVASNDTSPGAMEDLNPLESPLMCKDALDAAVRTPYGMNEIQQAQQQQQKHSKTLMEAVL